MYFIPPLILSRPRPCPCPQLVIARSRLVREQDPSEGYWKEMFDPVTNRFWYCCTPLFDCI
jgi:hypothetical protein